MCLSQAVSLAITVSSLRLQVPSDSPPIWGSSSCWTGLTWPQPPPGGCSPWAAGPPLPSASPAAAHLLLPRCLLCSFQLLCRLLSQCPILNPFCLKHQLILTRPD